MVPIRTIIISYLEDMSYSETAKRLNLNAGVVKTAIVNNTNKVRELSELRNVRLQIDSDWVLNELHKMYKSDIKDIHTDDGVLLPISEWPEIWRTMVSDVDSKTITSPDGTMIGTLSKVKKPNAMALLKMIGDQTDVKAFAKKDEATTERDDVLKELQAGRERAAIGVSGKVKQLEIAK